LKTPSFALWVWYRGEQFRGYQRQVQGPTVQGALEEALRSCGVARTPVAAGRTDLGVHARMQVVAFRAPTLAQDPASLNRALPGGCGVVAVRPAAPGFHPQFSAVEKEYRYRLLVRDPLSAWRPYAWHDPAWSQDLDPARLKALLRKAEGTRDFIAFHEKSSAQKLRTLSSCELLELRGGLWDVRLRGTGFGRYQVRYLVGTAVAVARGQLPEEAYLRALESGEPIQGTKAPASGLTLWEVRYPQGTDPFTADRGRPEGLPPGPPWGDPL